MLAVGRSFSLPREGGGGRRAKGGGGRRAAAAPDPRQNRAGHPGSGPASAAPADAERLFNPEPRTPHLPGREALADGVPVDDLPPGVDVVGPLVLIAEVVGVLPDVDAEARRVSLHVGAALVGGADDLRLPG